METHVAERVSEGINYRVIALCFAGGLGFHYSMAYYGLVAGQLSSAGYIIAIVSIINPLVTGIFAFVIAGLYRMSKTFGRSYILLGVGYLCAAAAETIYGVQTEIMRIDSYPSVSDLFFAALNIFWIAHVVANIRYFGTAMEYKNLIVFIMIFCAIVFSYIGVLLVQLGMEPNFEFFYGLLFVVLAGITLPFVVYAAMLFRDSTLGRAWHILLLAFMVNISGDVWYYYLEVFGQYDVYHPVNFFWYAGYWIQTYALFKHKQIS